jgi:hypothetical protein
MPRIIWDKAYNQYSYLTLRDAQADRRFKNGQSTELG